MKKAWIYTRTGYETNDKNENQLNAAIEYCKTNELDVRGCSSFNGESDTPMVLFENAFRKIEKEKPDVIVVESAGRIARNMSELSKIVLDLQQREIELLSVKEGKLANALSGNPLDFRLDIKSAVLDDDDITDEERRTHRFVDGINNYISNLDFQEICDSCNSDNPELAREALKQMHGIFVDVYGEEPLSRDDYNFVDMPAVIRGQNGKMCLGIVCLDLSSSGEHWGTTFFTPYGILEQGNQMSAVEQKFIRQFSPYSYWYSPEIEGDIHVDFDETPDDVAGILGSCRNLNDTESQILS